mmetsp:Transcript_89783/g.253195  ORF Transcript_89783/g.253195 Transcript_89783/m.253195 type:complete len:202 (+) Transcript_89783:1837-2442(+)
MLANCVRNSSHSSRSCCSASAVAVRASRAWASEVRNCSHWSSRASARARSSASDFKAEASLARSVSSSTASLLPPSILASSCGACSCCCGCSDCAAATTSAAAAGAGLPRLKAAAARSFEPFFTTAPAPFDATSSLISFAWGHVVECSACHAEMKHASEQNAVPQRQQSGLSFNTFLQPGLPQAIALDGKPRQGRVHAHKA